MLRSNQSFNLEDMSWSCGAPDFKYQISDVTKGQPSVDCCELAFRAMYEWACEHVLLSSWRSNLWWTLRICLSAQREQFSIKGGDHIISEEVYTKLLPAAFVHTHRQKMLMRVFLQYQSCMSSEALWAFFCLLNSHPPPFLGSTKECHSWPAHHTKQPLSGPCEAALLSSS